MNEPPDIRDRVPAAEWETFRRCRFVRRTFRPYPCLISHDPPGDEEAAFWQPYRGGPFDPALYELVEDGWDHEHCDVCRTRVTEGDAYWANDGSEHVDLCEACYALVRTRLQGDRDS